MSAQNSRVVHLVIVGAGGHGSEVAGYCRDLENVDLLGFVDEGRTSGTHAGRPILGGFDALFALAARVSPEPLHYMTAVGSNEIRSRVVERLRALELDRLVPWTLAHPGSYRGPDVEIREGACLAPGSIVTTQSQIGRHCILNVKASVSHDCVVGDFCNLNPGSVLCGNVTLGEGCYIGAGAIIRERVTIGPWTVVGAGAVVVGDLPGNATAVGVPAKVVKHRG